MLSFPIWCSGVCVALRGQRGVFKSRLERIHSRFLYGCRDAFHLVWHSRWRPLPFGFIISSFISFRWFFCWLQEPGSVAPWPIDHRIFRTIGTHTAESTTITWHRPGSKKSKGRVYPTVTEIPREIKEKVHKTKQTKKFSQEMENRNRKGPGWL